MTRVFTFPGQGSQAVGMGKALADASAAAREVFAEVDDALGQPLSQVIWEGPADALTLTANAQPALMAVSLAAIAAMKEAGVTVANSAAFVAGHSLGEYSALAAAGSLSVADAARLLRIRGDAMQHAVPVGAGAMAAILGLELAQVEGLAVEASQAGVCDVANDNGPGQVVVSGSKAAVEKAAELAKALGARRALMLPVSAPFHCSLMQPAADRMAEALAQVTLNAPSVPLIANVLAAPISDPDEIRGHLVAQVTGRVRWRESVLWMADNGVDAAFEIGAGKVLTGLAKRIAPGIAASSISTPDDIQTLN
ncbi:ACP S-malonyltransferase [Pararhizobium sp. IMCC21322]|uniref:ACP S-malonyltransferase n=1 Tax=Pararhizobium sp. IMCC21322 TaxID=3067903 RepID=UPI0027427BDE|nr:ACP S-malonyltransferase [Pararhizobium sp. IMCC21322]